MTPSLEIGNGNWAVQSDSLLGYKTINGKYYPREMSVVRATTGTRVNAEGLVEVVPYNIFTYSSSFSNADWLKVNSTVTGGQNGYDGTTNAFLITDNSTSGAHLIYQTPTVSGQHTISIYAKANTLDWVWLRGVQSSANVRAWFNLSTGTIGTVETNGTANIESVGNGWYRCSLTIANHQSGFEFYYGVANANATTSYVGSGQSIFVQDAQLVEGSEPLDYLPTTTRLNIARIDYSTGSPALLVEPQRTNLLTYSNTFSNSDWGTGGYGNIANVVSNDIISPDGLMNGSKITFSAGSTQSRLIQQVSVVNGGIYEASVYVKYGNKTNVSLYCDAAIIGLNATFNFTTKTLTAYGVTNPIVTELSDGWFRLQFTYTAPSSTSQIGFISNIGEDGFVYLYGAQCEQGSYATSYIPTTSASVTRNADVISKTGISSLIGQTEGTLFFDGSVPTRVGGSNIISFNYSSASSVALFKISNGQARAQIWVGGSVIISLFGTAFGSERVKIAVVYKSGNSILFINGTQIDINNTSFTFTQDLSVLNLPTGQSYFSNPNDVLINKIALFKTALTNSELAQLTTL
jgi:hypothetical protein